MKSLPKHLRPSLGFVLVLLSYSTTASILVYGLYPPALDRVWILEHELKAGLRSQLSTAELHQLSDTFASYPKLATGMMEGQTVEVLSTQRNHWSLNGTAVFLRSPNTPHQVELTVDSHPTMFPVVIELEASNWQEQLRFPQAGTLIVSLASSSSPEVVSVRSRSEPNPTAPIAFRLQLEAPQ